MLMRSPSGVPFLQVTTTPSSGARHHLSPRVGRLCQKRGEDVPQEGPGVAQPLSPRRREIIREFGMARGIQDGPLSPDRRSDDDILYAHWVLRLTRQSRNHIRYG